MMGAMDHASPHPNAFSARIWRAAGWLAAAAALGLVLMLYGNPQFLVMLSDMIWACFG